MGVSAHIDFDRYPKQGEMRGKVVQVCFNYDTSRVVEGVVLRDDMEGDGRTIIRLVDGRVVLDTECQYSLPPT